MCPQGPDKTIPDGCDTSSVKASAAGRNAALLVAAALAVATVAAFQGVRNSEFVSFDDPYYVTNNYHVKKGLSLDGARWALTEFHASNWHPLTWLSHMLDMQLFGLTPMGPHLVNLGFHVANTLLMFHFFLRTTKRLWPSAFVAAMFALHPLHVESVAWVSERKDVLSTFFWLLTMIAYASYASRPSAGRYIRALVLFALGLTAKPMLVTLPAVLLLLDFWPLGRVPAEPKKDRRRSRRGSLWPLVVEKIPFAGLSLASAAITLLAQRQAINRPQMTSIPTLLTNAVVSYGRYIWKMFWPANLAVYYPLPGEPAVAAALMVGAFVAACTIFALRYRKGLPYVLTGWLWYLVTLVPVAGFVQVGDQSHADRYTYIPLTGLFVIVAWGAAEIMLKRPALKGILTVAGAAAVAAAAGLTWQTVCYWKDGVSLFSRAVEVAPDNAKMESSLGACLANEGRVEEAMIHLEKAVRTIGHEGSAFNPLGTIYLEKGDYAKAIGYFTEAAKYDWMSPRAEYCLGAIYIELQQFDAAESHLRRAVQLEPYSVDACSLLAVALAGSGKPAEAMAAGEKAIELEPASARGYYARGHVLARKGDYAGAERDFSRSISLRRDYITFAELGDALFRLGRLAGSADAYHQAVIEEPGRPDAYYNLAFVLERLGRKDEALGHLERFLELKPGDADGQAMLRRLEGDRQGR